MADEYVCTLDEASLKVARDELNEDPKERLSQVETFRKWILEQKHLTSPTDTVFLLKYLRTAKFSQLRAREVLEGQLKIKYMYPEWLCDIDMADPAIQKFIATGFILPLPKRDAKGRVIVLADLGAFEPDAKLWDKNLVIKAMFGLSYYYVRKENDLVNGICFFEDVSHMSAKLMTFWGMDTMKKTTKLWQGNFPGRFKAFHYYNVGPIFETLMSVMKPLMQKKLQDRMVIHGKNMESVYKTIPMELFPREYLPDEYDGPCQGPRQEIIDNLLAELRSPAVRDRILYETDSKWKYDLKLKPDDVPNESFRKLNVE